MKFFSQSFLSVVWYFFACFYAPAIKTVPPETAKAHKQFIGYWTFPRPCLAIMSGILGSSSALTTMQLPTRRARGAFLPKRSLSPGEPVSVCPTVLFKAKCLLFWNCGLARVCSYLRSFRHLQKNTNFYPAGTRHDGYFTRLRLWTHKSCFIPQSEACGLSNFMAKSPFGR